MRTFKTVLCITVLTLCNSHWTHTEVLSNEKAPKIATIPAGLPWNQDNILKKELADIDSLRAKYTELMNDYNNTPHTGLVPGSNQDKIVLAKIPGVNNARADYIAAVKKFNADVAAVTASLSSPPLTRVPQGPDPSVNMGALYTDDEVRDARAALERLLKFKQGLEAKLAELSKWRAGIINDSKEFEALRAEAMRRDLSDILAAIPAVGIVNEFSKSAQYSKFITPELAHKFEVAYGTLSSLASQTDALTATEDSKTLQKTLDAVLGMQKVMLSFPMSKLPEGSKAKQYLTAMNTVFDASGKVIVFTQEKSSENWKQRAASLTLELGSTLPGQLGILSTLGVTTKNEIGRSRKVRITNEAIESLGGALGQNWNAKLKLTERLTRVTADIVEEDRLIQGHALAHPKIKNTPNN